MSNSSNRQSPIRWGLVGTGDIAEKRVAAALQALDPPGSLVAVASRRTARARAFAERHGIPEVYPSFEKLLADSNIDAVYIATPVYLHAPMTNEAARAGKHVLCEKPMALTFAQCQTMIRTCRKARVRLGVAYYRRFFPVVRKMKELLETESIGDVVLARGLVGEIFNPEGPAAPRRWFIQKRWSGGGPMMDFGCHRIDLMIYLLGDIVSARGELRNLRFKRRDVEDHAVGTLSFASARGKSQGPVGCLTATHCLSGEDQFEVIGTSGKLVIPNLGRGVLHAVTAHGPETFDLPPPSNYHCPLVEEFNQAVLDRREPLISGVEGAKTTRALDQIYGRL